MLSIVILTNKVIEDAGSRQQAILEVLKKYNVKYEITFVSSPQYNALQDIKGIVARNEKHNLIVLSDDANKNSQIYVGLDNTKGENALILDIDTNIELIEQIIQKYKDGCENVFVRQKKNAGHHFFTKLGMITYGMGLKLLKKLPDLCCDSSVILLSKSAIDVILNNPQNQRELLNTNLNPDQKFALIEQKSIHDSPNVNQKRAYGPMFSLGVLSTIFLIVTLAAMLIYPMFNGWIYSLWMFITIVIWLALSIAFCALLSKQVFNSRQGEPIPLDVDGYPIIHFNESLSHSDLYQQQEFMEFYNTDQQTESEKKTKKKATKKSSKSTKTDTKKATKKEPTKKTSKPKKSEPQSAKQPKKRGRPPKQK